MSPAINSMSSTGGESVTDINTKYQKLATEYAKLRSQVHNDNKCWGAGPL